MYTGRCLVRYPNHGCGSGGTYVYTGGSVVFDTLNHDSSQRRHDYQPSASSHAHVHDDDTNGQSYLNDEF